MLLREHHAVLYTCEALESRGYRLTVLPVDKYGMVSPSQLGKAISDETVLVSIMHANNEVGTVQPIRELAVIAHERGALFHTDAVQAVGHVEIDVKKQNIDLLSLSAHKFHGPKGIGALYIRKGILLSNLLEGGAQERGKRAGTENTASVVAAAVALEEALTDLDEKNKRVAAMRDRLIDGLLKIDVKMLSKDSLSESLLFVLIGIIILQLLFTCSAFSTNL